MSLDLAVYNSVYTALFVKITIPNYDVLRFSTHYKPYTITESDNIGYSYTNLGQLVSVSDTTAAIRTNPEEITVTISGIPSTAIAIFTEQAVKGSRIEVRRQYFTGDTYSPILAPVVKFKGIINNYNVNETWPDDTTSVGNCTIGLVCSTLVDLLDNKRAGRRTNPFDQKSFFPDDLSMDRVPTITGSNFNFGAAR
jgi:hypothetical protein